jgi:hypothetical protein
MTNADNFAPEPAWLDGYTGYQEAKEDHFAPDIAGAKYAEQELEAARGDDPAGFAAALARVEQERDQQRDLARTLGRALAAVEAERDRARAELQQLREHQEIRARVIRERNAQLDEIRQLLGIDMSFPPRKAADALRELLDELKSRRTFMADLVSQPSWIVARDGGRDCVRCDGEITRGQAYELTGLDDLQHIRCPINNGQEPTP